MTRELLDVENSVIQKETLDQTNISDHLPHSVTDMNVDFVEES